MAKSPKLYDMHSFSTSPNSRQRTSTTRVKRLCSKILILIFYPIQWK